MKPVVSERPRRSGDVSGITGLPWGNHQKQWVTLVNGWLMCWWMTLMENLRNHQNGWLMVDGWLMCCICSTVALIYCNDFNDEMIG